MPRHQFSILSTTKTVLSKASHLSQWGKLGPGGPGSEELTPEALDPSLSHLNPTVEGEIGRATLHPHLRQGQRKPSRGCPGEADLGLGAADSQPVYMTMYISWGATWLWLVISHSQLRELGKKLRWTGKKYGSPLLHPLINILTGPQRGSAPISWHTGLCPAY